MKLIVWDVDDVLNDLMRVWLESAWRPGHPGCDIRYEAIAENPPHRILGTSRENYLASLDVFRMSRAGRKLEPVAEVVSWFIREGHRFRHAALTAVPLGTASISAEWVVSHFGRWIRSFNFVPSKRSGDPVYSHDLSKSDFLCWWGRADILIDDNPVHVDAARHLGMNALLMPRPWNQSRQTLSEVLESLAAMADP